MKVLTRLLQRVRRCWHICGNQPLDLRLDQKTSSHPLTGGDRKPSEDESKEPFCTLFRGHEDEQLRVFAVLREDLYETRFGDGWYVYLECAFLSPEEADRYKSTLDGDAAVYHAYHVVEWRFAIVDGNPCFVAGPNPNHREGPDYHALRRTSVSEPIFCDESEPLMVPWATPRPRCKDCDAGLSYRGEVDGCQSWLGTWCMECAALRCPQCAPVQPGSCPECKSKLWPPMAGVIPDKLIPSGEPPCP